MSGRPRTSLITGRRQAVALRLITAFAALAAAVGILVPGPFGVGAATIAVATVTATPLLRVMWLTLRWWQERDSRFVALGLALLGVIAAGSLFTWAARS